MNKIIKYMLIIAGGLFIIYNSVYFKPLDEIKAEAASKIFDPLAYSLDFWENKLIPNLDQAVGLNTLLDLLKSNPAEAFGKHSNALGIGNIRFFLVQETAKVTQVNEDHVVLSLDNDHLAILATDYIFGNAIRDASGQIDINEFTNTMDFNNVSSEINQLVVANVLPDFIATVQQDDILKFYGAIELNQEHLQLEQIEIIPIQLSIENTIDQ